MSDTTFKLILLLILAGLLWDKTLETESITAHKKQTTETNYENQRNRKPTPP